MGRAGEHYTAQQFIDAIPGTGGIVTGIAKRVGCSWHTAKRYIDMYATVRQAYDDECEAILDMAELRTIEKIKEGEWPVIRYYLSTKGRHRGYVTRQEIETINERELDAAIERELARVADSRESTTAPISEAADGNMGE